MTPRVLLLLHRARTRRAHSSGLLLGSAAGGALGFAACSQPPALCASWFERREKYHLRYFDARGVVETARMVMVLGGAHFTDARWPLDFSKPRDSMSPAMTAARSEGALRANLDRALSWL